MFELPDEIDLEIVTFIPYWTVWTLYENPSLVSTEMFVLYTYFDEI
jgi:hypothetical protein